MSAKGSYTTKFKLEIVKYAVTILKNHRKLVQAWCKQENDVLAISSWRRRLPGGGMKAKYRGIDKQLLLEQQESNHRVSRKRRVGYRAIARLLRAQPLSK